MVRIFIVLFATILYSGSCLKLTDRGEAAPPSSVSNTASVTEEEITVVDEDIKKFSEDFAKTLGERLKFISRKNELKPLSDSKVSNGNIEFRLHLIAGYYGPIYRGYAVEDAILMIRKVSGNWTGEITRNVVGTKDKKVLKQTLIEPASGWENYWNQLRTLGITEKPALSEVKIQTDKALYIVEVSENSNYSFTYFHSPKEKSQIEEERRIASIFNLTAAEFAISDLKAN